MNFQDWLNQNTGKIVLTPDPPNGINGQCVNLASSWSMAQGGPQLFGIGDSSTAYRIWQTFRHPFYQVINNAPDNAPAPGDIVFYAPNNAGAGTGSAGHVDIAVDSITTNSFRALDTDWNGNPASQLIPHSYAGVVGWFHPVPPPTPTPSVDTPTADNEGVVNGAGLRGHAAPNTGSPAVWQFDDNEHITLVARTQGETVGAGPYAPSSWWYLAHGNDANAKAANYPLVWVSDSYVRTTHDPANVTDYVAPSPAPAPIPGPVYSPRPQGGLFIADVSSVGQGVIDWSQLSKSIDGVIIRAGHVGASFGGGADDTDQDLAINRDAARAAGLPLGFYWFCYPSLNPADEAKHFLNSIGALHAGESLWADIETDDPTLVAWAKSFKSEVEALAGRKCRGYFNRDFATRYPGLLDLFASDGIWGADFDGNAENHPFNGVVMHQYTSTGKLPGVSGAIDLSEFWGTADQFRALGDQQAAPPAPAPTPAPDPAPAPKPKPAPKPQPIPAPLQPSWWQWILLAIKKFLGLR